MTEPRRRPHLGLIAMGIGWLILGTGGFIYVLAAAEPPAGILGQTLAIAAGACTIVIIALPALVFIEAGMAPADRERPK